MIRQPRRLAAIANSRPSSPEPSSINLARYISGGDSGAAIARLDRAGSGEERMRSLLLVTAAALLIGAAPAKKLLTPNDVVAQSPASAWKAIPADDLMVIDLANGGRVVVQLAPQFAPVHVANIKALARGRYWDGASVYRVQDNYVAQWGLNESDKPWPAGVTPKPPAEYTRPLKGLWIKPLGFPDPYAPGA